MGAQGPLIPLVIAGALPIMPPGSPFINLGVWKRKVILEILPSVPTSGKTEEDVEELTAGARVHVGEIHRTEKKRIGSAQAGVKGKAALAPLRSTR
ncbi:MAG: hypothetical protein R2827_15240 [Bdellovibrionales bacterium]